MYETKHDINVNLCKIVCFQKSVNVLMVIRSRNIMNCINKNCEAKRNLKQSLAEQFDLIFLTGKCPQLYNCNGFCVVTEAETRYLKDELLFHGYKDQIHLLDNIDNDINDVIITTGSVMVRTDHLSCIDNNHTLQYVNGLISVYSNKEKRFIEVSVPVAYCAYCNRYYITENNYNELKKFGFILCKVIFWSDARNQKNNDWSSESILKSFGYSVSKQKGLSAYERRFILNMVIENNIMKEREVVSFIQWLIRQNLNRRNMQDAIAKWNSDIDFLQAGKVVENNLKVRQIFIKNEEESWF